MLLETVQMAQEAEKLFETDINRAVDVFRKVCDLNPYDDMSHMNYGVSLATQGNGREGIKWIEKALKINPDNEKAKNSLKLLKQELL